MQQKIYRHSHIFPAIHDEMCKWMGEEKYCDAYLKGFNQGDHRTDQAKKCHQVVLAMASPVLKQALLKATDGKQMCCCAERSSFSEGCFVFDGCIVFDECHRAKNLWTGSSSSGGKPTKTGLTVKELQDKLPNAR